MDVYLRYDQGNHGDTGCHWEHGEEHVASKDTQTKDCIFPVFLVFPRAPVVALKMGVPYR